MKHLALALLLLALGAHSVSAAARPRWILITAPALWSAMEPLAELRLAQGWDVVMIERDGSGEPERNLELVKQAAGDAPNVCVVLAGARPFGFNKGYSVRGPYGTHGRMKYRSSDQPMSNPEPDGTPRWAVGRLPATSSVEAAAMVTKIIAFEKQTVPSMARLIGLAGHPGGKGIQRGVAEVFLNTLVHNRLAALDPQWQTRMFVHNPASPYYLPNAEIGRAFLHEWSIGSMVSFYLGHSSASGFGSDGSNLVTGQSLRTILHQHSAIFFTCGCLGLRHPYNVTVATQPKQKTVTLEGYGISAMRNPKGPPAVIGAEGLTSSPMGLLALDGLLTCFNKPEPPATLGQLWMAAIQGITRGPIDPAVFTLMDKADGSKGTISLKDQRLEHAEMWCLLGDPAMRLPAVPHGIQIKLTGALQPTSPIEITGTVPAAFAGTTVKLTLERTTGPILADKSVTDAAELHARHAQANDRTLASATATCTGCDFKTTLTLPADLPWDSVIVRVTAEKGTQWDQGTAVLSK